MTGTINELVEDLTTTAVLELSHFEGVFEASFQETQQNRFWTFYEFTPNASDYELCELRLDKSGERALLILNPSESSPISESTLDLGRWGEPSDIDINPHIPPEGIEAYIYEIVGVKVSFQLTYVSRNLLTLTLEWGGS